MLDALKIDKDVVEEVERVPGAGVQTVDSGVWDAVIQQAYLIKSSNGALGLKLHVSVEPSNVEIRETLWVTSRDDKGNKNYYVTKDGKKRLLLGMIQANDLARVVTGKDLSELEPEQKVVNVWSPEARKEVPTKVPVYMDLVRKRVKVATRRHITNAQQKVNNDWVPSNQKREFNSLDKFFNEDGYTATEILAEAKETYYKDKWEQQWDMKTVDTYKEVPEPKKQKTPFDDDDDKPFKTEAIDEMFK